MQFVRANVKHQHLISEHVHPAAVRRNTFTHRTQPMLCDLYLYKNILKELFTGALTTRTNSRLPCAAINALSLSYP